MLLIKRWAVRFCVAYTIISIGYILYLILTNDGATAAC